MIGGSMKYKFTVLIISIVMLMIVGCSNNTYDTATLLSKDVLSTYFEQHAKDWNIEPMSVDKEYSKVLTGFLVKNAESKQIFTISNLITDDKYKISILAYTRPHKSTLGFHTSKMSLNKENQNFLIQTILDLSNFTMSDDVLEQIELIKQDEDFSSCDEILLFRRDPNNNNRYFSVKYLRDVVNLENVNLSSITVSNKEMLLFLKNLELTNAFPQKIRTIDFRTLYGLYKKEDSLDDRINYLVTGMVKYDLSNKPKKIPNYLVLNNVAVDTIGYDFGYIESANDKIPVLIPNFFSVYDDLKDSEHQIALTYCREERVFLVRSYRPTK